MTDEEKKNLIEIINTYPPEVSKDDILFDENDTTVLPKVSNPVLDPPLIAVGFKVDEPVVPDTSIILI